MIRLATVAMCWISFAALAADTPFKYQGFNMMAFGKSEYANLDLVVKSLDYIVAEGSKLVTIDWNVTVADDGSVLSTSDPASFEPMDTDIKRVIELAHQRGLNVFLKPHVGFPNDPFSNRGTWNTDMTKFSLAKFFGDWTAYLHGWGVVASAMSVEGL
ncbi:MAG TPA: hypothetical protein VMM27_17095, partial [Casimicrobiaceae bacterium]|nr:hypothetical protein [Casimicrobiaceae bacterium]